MTNPDSTKRLTISDVRFGYVDQPAFLGPISFSIEPGQCWGILGPNGAGKSTLLRLMVGLLKPKSGNISYENTELGSMSSASRAKRIAFMPQNIHIDVDLNARSIVLMGRHPHRSLGLFESNKDFQIADQAMRVTETSRFADRALSTLSGGEMQRVHLAAALSQEPRLLLLDEPTASLDVQHQLAIFRILRDRTLHEKLAVVVVTHDFNLASRYCSHVLLLDQGQQIATGSPSQVLTPDILSKVYGVDMVSCTTSESSDRKWLVPIDPADHKET